MMIPPHISTMLSRLHRVFAQLKGPSADEDQADADLLTNPYPGAAPSTVTIEAMSGRLQVEDMEDLQGNPYRDEYRAQTRTEQAPIFRMAVTAFDDLFINPYLDGSQKSAEQTSPPSPPERHDGDDRDLTSNPYR